MDDDIYWGFSMEPLKPNKCFFFAQMRSSQGRVIFILHIDLKIRWEEKGLRIKKITLSIGKRVKQTNPRKSVIFWHTSLEMCGKGRKRNLSPSRHPKWTFHYLITEKKDFLNNIATSFCFFFFKARVNDEAVQWRSVYALNLKILVDQPLFFGLYFISVNDQMTCQKSQN